MAEISVAETKSTVYTLVLQLNEFEARCLKAMVQNPIDPAESVTESKLREQIFTKLHEVV
jgi:hypothetical protein